MKIYPITIPGGSDTYLQYNNGGIFGGVASATYNDATGAITFQPAADSTTFFQVKDAAGTGLAGNFDTTNLRFGVRTLTPVYMLGTSFDGTYEVGFDTFSTGPAIKWNEGNLYLTNDEANTNANIYIQGNGTGFGSFRVFDEDQANNFYTYCSVDSGWLQLDGATPFTISIDYPAETIVRLFGGAASGETQEFKIYGYRVGDAKRSLEVGVGVDAADTASFDGLSNYWFDGAIEANGALKATGYTVNIIAKTAAYTATATDDVITCGAGNETFTIDLPVVSAGKTYYIKNVGTGVITVDADTTGSTTIDGDTTQTINQYECLKVVADASVYWAI